jgi:hypothetical protein
MIDPGRRLAQDEQDEAAREPEVDAETVKDLTPDTDLAAQVRAGATTPKQICECGTA